ncbi:MAG: hypothetical protein ACOYN3_08750 [Acidimicrobiia bacterium]
MPPGSRPTGSLAPYYTAIHNLEKEIAHVAQRIEKLKIADMKIAELIANCDLKTLAAQAYYCLSDELPSHLNISLQPQDWGGSSATQFVEEYNARVVTFETQSSAAMQITEAFTLKVRQYKEGGLTSRSRIAQRIADLEGRVIRLNNRLDDARGDLRRAQREAATANASGSSAAGSASNRGPR